MGWIVTTEIERGACLLLAWRHINRSAGGAEDGENAALRREGRRNRVSERESQGRRNY